MTRVLARESAGDAIARHGPRGGGGRTSIDQIGTRPVVLTGVAVAIAAVAAAVLTRNLQPTHPTMSRSHR